jgi:carbamoyl-phosphate synthase large subunit
MRRSSDSARHPAIQEALQKACQSLEIKRNGLGADGKELRNQDQILDSLKRPSWNRLFHIYDAFKMGIPFSTIKKLTKIDSWFLNQIEELVEFEKEIEKNTLDTLSKDLIVLCILIAVANDIAGNVLKIVKSLCNCTILFGVNLSVSIFVNYI